MTFAAYADRPRLQNSEIVVRYVGGSHVDPGTGAINGSAFDRTPKDVDGVSLTRRGVLAHEAEADRAAIRHVVGGRLRLGKTAVFAELRAGSIGDCLRSSDSLFLCQDPLPEEPGAPANPAHALLIGLPFVGEAVGSLKSELAGDQLKQHIQSRFPAVI